MRRRLRVLGAIKFGPGAGPGETQLRKDMGRDAFALDYQGQEDMLCPDQGGIFPRGLAGGDAKNMFDTGGRDDL